MTSYQTEVSSTPESTPWRPYASRSVHGFCKGKVQSSKTTPRSKCCTDDDLKGSLVGFVLVMISNTTFSHLANFCQSIHCSKTQVDRPQVQKR